MKGTAAVLSLVAAAAMQDALLASKTAPTGSWRTFNGWTWKSGEASNADAFANYTAAERTAMKIFVKDMAARPHSAVLAVEGGDTALVVIDDRPAVKIDMSSTDGNDKCNLERSENEKGVHDDGACGSVRCAGEVG